MSCDPLGCQTGLDLAAEFHPLGFPFTLRTNSPLVLDAARKSFACFPSRFPEPRIEARLIVADYGSDSIPAAPVFRAQHNLLAIVSDAANFAVCDLEKAFAFGCVSPAVAADADFLRFHFLEAIAYTLLVQLCVTPVHASCVAHNEIGVLLCGTAGAGKSSLAYACARQGWSLVSDNACYLLDSAPGPLVAGRPQSIRLRSTALDLFPELDGSFPAARANGKFVLDLTAGRRPDISTALGCPVGFLVFLDRRAGSEARLLPVARDTATERLLDELQHFRDEVDRRHRQSILNLVQAGGTFELRYDNAEDATQQLERLVNGL
jgi:hypothetical protein